LLDLTLVVARQRVDGVVVRDEEPVEPEFLFQNLCQQTATAGTLHAVPTVVRGHDGPDPGADGRDVALHVNLAQFPLRQTHVALVEPPALLRVRTRHPRPPDGAAVRRVMLGAREDAQRVTQVCALKPADGRLAQHSRQLRRLAEPLVSPAPTLVARDGDARREGPVDARRADLHRGDARRLFDEARAARAAEPDVVREDHGAEDVVMAVNSIDAVEQRYGQTRLERARLVVVVHVGPVLEAVPGLGVAVAAAEE
jgi:hypothetical protein